MTGYGHAEVARGGITAISEIRSVNSRFLEIAVRLPHTLALRENDVKELVRKKMQRGKINVVVTVEHDNMQDVPLKVNRSAAKSYHKLLADLRKASGIKGTIALEHLLQFSDVFEPRENDLGSDREWNVAEQSLDKAVEELVAMRRKEGAELKADLVARIGFIAGLVEKVGRLGKEKIPVERTRLRERMMEILEDRTLVDENRLELELTLLADKLDITEECVRFRSHNKFFLDSLANGEAVGRKLNFLLQEMNREANTIGSKSFDSDIAHDVVAIKEELEKIREQLQNIE